LHIIFVHWKCIENRTVWIIYKIDQKKERIRTKKQLFDRKKATICLLIVLSFLISVTVAAAANNSVIEKGSHVAKKVKKEIDPDIAAGKTDLTPLQANKYNLGDYAGSSTTIDTPDGASNTINMGVNSGIQFDDGPHPGNKILHGPHAGTVFNFGNYPGITINDGPKRGFAGVTHQRPLVVTQTLNAGLNTSTDEPQFAANPKIQGGKYVDIVNINNTKIPIRYSD